MKKSSLILTFLVILTINFSKAQNLLVNPSFENYNQTFCGIMMSSDFENTLNDWNNPTQASPQVFFTNIEPDCYNLQPLNEYPGPIGIKGSQWPRTGGVMCGLWMYTIEGFNQRQYIQAELSTSMVIGNSYVVEFHVSLADSMEFYIDKIGAHLSANPISGIDDSPLNYTPQIEADGFISETENWVSISDTIVAQEAHSFITIGNFYDDNSTNTMSNLLASGAVSTYGAYYFVDDVRVDDLSIVSTPDIQGEEISIYPTLVRDVLNLNIPHDSQVRIFNSRGQLVYSEEVQDDVGTFDMSEYSKGVYIVSIQYGEHSLVERVVKM